MLIFNKTWLDNQEIREYAANWLKKGLINTDEQKAINGRYETLYTKGSFLGQAGLFILTSFIIICSTVFLFVLFGVISFGSYRYIILFEFLILYFSLEVYMHSGNEFPTGILKGVLYFSLLFLYVGITWNFYGLSPSAPHYDELFYYLLFLPFVVFAALRFADEFLAFAAYCLLIYINCLLILKLGSFGKLLLPFEGMAVSLILLAMVKRLQKIKSLHYWKECFWAREIGGLLSFYIFGNYLVVRKLTEVLLNVVIGPGEDIHFAFFFYVFTIAIPLLYIYLGLKRKDYLRLRLGLLLEAGGIASIRYYHHFISVEGGLMLGGTIMTLLGWLGMKYFKNPVNGIIYSEQEPSAKDTLTSIASVALSATVTQGIPVKPKEDVKFGGGEFGGGGAGAEY